MTKCSSMEPIHLHVSCDASANLECTNFLRCSSTNSQGLSFLSFSTTFKSFRKHFHALLAANLQPRLSVEVFRLGIHLQQQSFNASLRFTTLRPLPRLCTTCMDPEPNCASGMNENKICLYLNPSVSALLADNSTALLAGILWLK
jgi:hypothetical protein